MSVTVTTQAELDAALAARESLIYISSPEGVWLRLTDSGSSHVVAWGSSHVVARGSSHVVARDSSHVVAPGSSHVVASGSSHVEASGSSHVEARDSSHVVAWGSSHVVARGSSHVVASGSSHVEARDSSHVVARDSSHVEARDSSHVEARDSSHVVAWGSSHVVARDSSHVEAKPYVAVHLHSARAQVEGGVVIDIASINQADPQTWLDMQGVAVEDGHAVVFKAVDDQLRSGRGQEYPIGGKVTVGVKGWKADGGCGSGLHFGPTPRHAKDYHREATRFLACRIPVKHASGIPGGTAKIKARECVVLYEVDLDGRRLDAEGGG